MADIIDPTLNGARFLRQLDLADPSKFKHPVTILGVGAVGSAAAMAVAKLGTPHGVTLIDLDTFEEHNLANQICVTRDKGRSKALSTAQLLTELGSVSTITAYNGKLDGDWVEYRESGYFHPTRPPDVRGESKIQMRQIARGIVISTPDSMKARQDLWKACQFNFDVHRVIDARMAGQYLQILVADPHQMVIARRYAATLIDDKDTTPEPCSARGVIDTSMFAGAWIGNIVRKLQMGQPVWEEIRMDLLTGELTLTLPNGKRVTNQVALAEAMVE